MTAPIPHRLAQRKRELEDLRQKHVDSIRDIDGQLTGINEAIQAYAEEAAEQAAATASNPGENLNAPPAERTRAPRRDFKAMIREFLGGGTDARQHTPEEIAKELALRPQQVRDALAHLEKGGTVTKVGADHWRGKPFSERIVDAGLAEVVDGRLVEKEPPPDDGPAARAPSLALAQDAA